MKLVFCLFRYFPYGGLQRDFMRIAKKCFHHGHDITVYCMEWHGLKPDFLKIHIVPKTAYSNHQNALNFSHTVKNILQSSQVDLVFGFDKIAGLDLYYCADSCYVAKVAVQKSGYIKKIYSFTARYKIFKSLEEAVFNKSHATKILFISNKEQQNYQNIYDIDKSRCFLLPPHIDKQRFNPIIDEQAKQKLKKEFSSLLNLDSQEPWLLMVGSGFRTKGVDRSIQLVQSLLTNNLKVNLVVIGQDKPHKFIKLAKRYGVHDRIRFLSGREDIADFMAISTLLLHPAYRENTGTVILESIIMGLPAVVSGTCGYSDYVTQSGCGEVIAEPFDQQIFDKTVFNILINNKNVLYKQHGLTFRDTADIYNADDKIIDIIEGRLYG